MAAVHVSNLLGEVLDVPAMVQAVHAQAPNAHTVVDGVAYAPHIAIDAAAWGVDWCAAQAMGLLMLCVGCLLDCVFLETPALADLRQLSRVPSLFGPYTCLHVGHGRYIWAAALTSSDSALGARHAGAAQRPVTQSMHRDQAACS